jgi:Ca-activated chloride channel family protein
MTNIVFAYPEVLYFLFIIPLLVAWFFWKDRDAHATLQMSSLNAFKGTRFSYRYYLRYLLLVIRLSLVAIIIIILARPQSTNKWQNVTTEGIDIVIALDISSSMLAQDLKPNRLEASKDVAVEFISGRAYDRMGLVVYSAESFTQCPLTTDHAVLINLFNDIESGMIEDGTAIGMGLATGVSRLKDSKAISKVIILLTDGMNNTGSIAPLSAAEIARSFGIRVYTIGVGTNGMAPMPVQTPYGTSLQNVPVEIDEDILTKIASITDGKYFRATDNQKLKEIYQEIDKMEKSKIDVREYSKKEEEYLSFGIIALFLLLAELTGRYVFLRSLP